jgi:hypothetical protein
MVNDTASAELDAVAVQTANTIKVLQAARDNELSSLDTLYGVPADIKSALSNIDTEQDRAKLDELLSGQVAKLKVVQEVAAIKNAGFVVDANQTPEQIEAVYRSVIKNRRSRAVGPFPFILSPNECSDESDWKSIVPANSCNPAYAKTLSHKMNEGFKTFINQLTGTPEACGNGVPSGVVSPSNFCASQRFQKALGAGSPFLQEYAQLYSNLEVHCANDYNSSGGNNRQFDGGAWRNDRYQHGCKYNEFSTAL